MEPLGLEYVPVDTDNAGLQPEKLASVLSQWPASKPKPRVLYTIPTGSNPTGASQPLARRQQTYAIAQEHDLIILEDDPYYFLQFLPERTPRFRSSACSEH